VRKTGQD